MSALLADEIQLVQSFDTASLKKKHRKEKAYDRYFSASIQLKYVFYLSFLVF